MNDMSETPRRNISTPLLVLGIAIVIFGIGLTLDNLFPNYDVSHYLFRLWPLILVVIGISKYRKDSAGSNIGPVILIAVGLGLLLKTLGHGQVEDVIGPLILVALGIFVVVKALSKGRSVPPELARKESFIQGSAILSGFKRRVLAQDFMGGELTAIFGGFELDLRQAAMEGDQVRIDVFVLFGGGEIQVPQNWEVINRSTAIAGAIEDKTLPLSNPEGPRPKLLITGVALFGGVEIKS